MLPPHPKEIPQALARAAMGPQLALYSMIRLPRSMILKIVVALLLVLDFSDASQLAATRRRDRRQVVQFIPIVQDDAEMSFSEDEPLRRSDRSITEADRGRGNSNSNTNYGGVRGTRGGGGRWRDSEERRYTDGRRWSSGEWVEGGPRGAYGDYDYYGAEAAPVVPVVVGGGGGRELTSGQSAGLIAGQILGSLFGG